MVAPQNLRPLTVHRSQDFNIDRILDCSSLLFSTSKPLNHSDFFEPGIDGRVAAAPGMEAEKEDSQISSDKANTTRTEEGFPEIRQDPSSDSVHDASNADNARNGLLIRSHSADNLGQSLESALGTVPKYKVSRFSPPLSRQSSFKKSQFDSSGTTNLPFPFNGDFVVGERPKSLKKNVNGNCQKPPKPPKHPKKEKPTNIYLPGQEGLSPRQGNKVRRAKSQNELSDNQSENASDITGLPKGKVRQSGRRKTLNMVLALLLTVLFGVLLIFQGSTKATESIQQSQKEAKNAIVTNWSLETKPWKSGPRKGGPGEGNALLDTKSR